LSDEPKVPKESKAQLLNWQITNTVEYVVFDSAQRKSRLIENREAQKKETPNQRVDLTW